MLPVIVSSPPPLPVSGLGTVTTVPRFETVSVYWRPDSAGSRGHATFRVQGSEDAYRTSLDFYEDSGEYRGKIIYLAAGTTYELRLHVDGSVVGTVSFTTWDEHDPVRGTGSWTISETREVVCVTGSTGTWSDGDSISSPSMTGGTLKGAGAITAGVGHLVYTAGTGSVADAETITNATSGATATASAAGLQTSALDLDSVAGATSAWIKYKPSATGVTLDGVDLVSNVLLKATKFVMIRGFALKNAEQHCIFMENEGGAPTEAETSDIVIEDNDLTNFGRVALHITTASLTGTPQVGEVITGRDSGATGTITDYILDDTPTTHLIQYAKDDGSNTRFTSGEIIDGGTSSFDAVVATLSGYAVNLDNAVHTVNGAGINFKRIIVQRNDFYDPRGDANSWGEHRRDTCGDNPNAPVSCHPQGADPVFFKNSGGNNVIRYNTVRGSGPEIDDDTTGHWWKDGIAGAENDDDFGYPGADSDIHGNKVTEVWDNCLEPEGGGKNVLVLENWASEGIAPMAISPVRLGPIYIVRNVFHHFRRSFGDGFRAKTIWVKNSPTAGFNGQTHIYCNTLWSPDDGGGRHGVNVTGGGAFNFIGRNNIIKVTGRAWSGGAASANNDVDYELTDGTFQNIAKGANVVDGVATYCDLLDVSNISGDFTIGETITGGTSGATAIIVSRSVNNAQLHIDNVVGTFQVEEITGGTSLETADIDTITALGSFALASTSLGIGVGEAVANVTDKWDVANDDIGAQQRGQPIIEFGHLAYL